MTREKAGLFRHPHMGHRPHFQNPYPDHHRRPTFPAMAPLSMMQ
jgi:hypothetical protein